MTTPSGSARCENCGYAQDAHPVLLAKDEICLEFVPAEPAFDGRTVDTSGMTPVPAEPVLDSPARADARLAALRERGYERVNDPRPAEPAGERTPFEEMRVVERVKLALGNIHDNLVIYSQNNGTSLSTGDVKELLRLVERQGPVVDESASLSREDEAVVMSTWLTLHNWKDGTRDGTFAKERLTWLAKKVRALAALPSAPREREVWDELVRQGDLAVESLPPFYAYGDNEAACQMADTIKELRNQIREAGDAALSPSPDGRNQ